MARSVGLAGGVFVSALAAVASAFAGSCGGVCTRGAVAGAGVGAGAAGSPPAGLESPRTSLAEPDLARPLSALSLVAGEMLFGVELGDERFSEPATKNKQRNQ